jgi:hypothetical protein
MLQSVFKNYRFAKFKFHPVSPSEIKPQHEERECVNVLCGKGYRVFQGVVIDEYGTMVE